MKLPKRNISITLAFVMLFSCAVGFFSSVKADTGKMNTENHTDIFTNGWLILFLSLAVIFAIYLFFKNFTKLKLENFESFTTHNALITKIRILSILSLLLFPLVEYYEGVYLKLYLPEWLSIGLVTAVSFANLLLTFKKNLRANILALLPQISYSMVYVVMLYKAYISGMQPIMAVEIACLLLFAKLIFDKLKNVLYFLLLVFLVSFYFTGTFDIQEEFLRIYISGTIQAAIVTVALFLIEGSSNRKIAFGDKILQSSNLYILVADNKAEFVFVNPQLEATTGLDSNAILRNGWWDYLGNDSTLTKELKQLITDSIAKNINSNYESTIKDKDGNNLYVSWDNTVIEGKYLLAVGKNITQSKQLQIEENKRKEKVENYNLVINDLTRYPYSENDNLVEILQNISKSVALALGVERVSIWDYYDSKLVCINQFFVSENAFESGVELQAADFPVYFAAIGEARIIDAPDAYNHPDTKEFNNGYFPSYNIKSLLDVPIFINGKLIGVLCCEQTKRQLLWDTEDINFVKAATDFVALSIEASKRKELEREYRYILNNVGDIIYTTDALGNFDFINKTATKILGYDAESLKGKHFSTIMHEDYKKKITVFYLRQFKQRIESTYQEFKVISKDGETRWVGQSVKLVYEKNNPEKIKGFQAVVRDINKQKETEIALVNSENNLRQLNENINETFFLYNYSESKFDYISPNCNTILGAGQKYFYEGNDYIHDYILTPKEAPVLALNYARPDEKEYEIEYRIKFDGKEKWIKEKSFPIKDSEGRIIKRSGICSDVTEKKLQEETLKQLSLVASTVSNGVVITNAEGLIEWCNASFLSLTEFELEELIGKRPIKVFSGPETPTELKEEILKTTLENSYIEIPQYTKTGKLKWFLITNTTILDEEGKVKKQIEIITDITERKALEKEYRYILNNAGDVIYTTNEKGFIVFLNDAITKILGYEQSEIINKHFTSIIHADDKKRVAMFYLKQFASKKEDSYCEFRVIDKAGETHWVGQNVKLVLEGKEVRGFQSILRDISKQKETELALVESENNFRQISEAISDVFYLYNIAENKYEYISPNSINILGVDSVYFYYTNNYINDYVIEKDRYILKDAVEKINSGVPFEIEYRVKVDLEIRWIKEKAFAIKDDQGRVVKTSGTCVDVTQKKMQEKNLLKINKELSVYSEDLAINNLLKEQLIYTNSFEEIARVSLNTLKLKIQGIARGSLFLVNENNNGFEVFYLEREEVQRETYDYGDLKSYKSLKEGKKFIEHNVDMAVNLSKSDLQRKKDKIRSYIMLPINYSTELIGALSLEFETAFSLTRREMDILENFTSVLSVVVNKLNLQKQLSEKSKDILASLNYAKSIQQSILPNIAHHKDTVSKFMTLYMPKDVVSGDFFVVESFDEYTLLALGDCTGHGVPGAFLTLLGSNFLQRIAIENKVTSPASILESLDYQLFTMLNKNRAETIRDGMELGLCIYNKKTKTLTFAGAGLFLVYYRNNEQVIVPGSKRSIGDENHSKVDFEQVTIELNGTEKFYLFSDGYRDQLGGLEKRKRFSRARFLELLHKIKNLPPFQQEFLLKLELEKHKGKVEQTDDISVIGFELK
ncbi:MAG: PAS domain S-box protein [Bacteroidia bacterium]|nr:PAS domain S-box protein [Bacteroidia bacterium]